MRISDWSSDVCSSDLGWTVSGTAGRHRVKTVRVNPVAKAGQVGPARRIDCDVLLMCGGWTPSVHLFSHTRGKLDWNGEGEMFLPGEQAEESRSAGAGNGRIDLPAELADGASARQAAAKKAGLSAGASTHGQKAEEGRVGRAAG